MNIIPSKKEIDHVKNLIASLKSVDDASVTSAIQNINE